MSLATFAKSRAASRYQVTEQLLLSMSAGAVNAGAYLACQRFVSHVTGTVTLIGTDLGSWSLVAEYALVLLCFLAGAVTAVFLLALAPPERYPAQSLQLVALLVALVAPLGYLGLFGTFGKSVETPGDFVLLSLLSFAMGLLNGTVAGSSAIGTRITHLTGHATELGMNLARACLSRGRDSTHALSNVALLSGKILSFAVGAAAMVWMVRWGGYGAFLSAAALTLLASALGRRAYEYPAHQPSSAPSWHAEPSYN